MSVVRLDEDDLDEEDLAILKEVHADRRSLLVARFSYWKTTGSAIEGSQERLLPQSPKEPQTKTVGAAVCSTDCTQLNDWWSMQV